MKLFSVYFIFAAAVALLASDASAAVVRPKGGVDKEGQGLLVDRLRGNDAHGKIMQNAARGSETAQENGTIKT
eukprot:scaffold2422_cov56-Attheya_sp.AAC.5